MPILSICAVMPPPGQGTVFPESPRARSEGGRGNNESVQTVKPQAHETNFWLHLDVLFLTFGDLFYRVLNVERSCFSPNREERDLTKQTV